MIKADIEKFEKRGQISSKNYDKNQIDSLLNSILINTRVTSRITMSEESATVIFREFYESIRQVGDALWWVENYEPQNHNISLEMLKKVEELSPEQKVKLNSLERFKLIRHDINYRGFKASLSQAREIKVFWNDVGKNLLKFAMGKNSEK